MDLFLLPLHIWKMELWRETRVPQQSTRSEPAETEADPSRLIPWDKPSSLSIGMDVPYTTDLPAAQHTCMSWIPLQSACYPRSYKTLKHSRKMNPEFLIPKVSAIRWSFQLLVLGKNGRHSDLQGQLSNSPITERQNLYSSILRRGCSGNKFLGKRSLFFFFWLLCFVVCLINFNLFLSLSFYGVSYHQVLTLSRALGWCCNNIIVELLSLESFRSHLKAKFSP